MMRHLGVEQSHLISESRDAVRRTPALGSGPVCGNGSGLAGVVVGVSTFLLGAAPAPGTSDPILTVWLCVLLPIGSLVVAVLVAAARANGPRRSVLLGAAAGLCLGVIAVLTKATTFLLGQGLSIAARHWEPYLLIAVGILALVCSQSAYQSGPIA